MGRVNFGNRLRDEKGIVGGIRLGMSFFFGWQVRPVPISPLPKPAYRKTDGTPNFPCLLRGTFYADGLADTFVELDGFVKGNVFINGFNLGRYWNEAGPQRTLYLPAPLLREGENKICVFELQGCEKPEIILRDTPILG